ncbi:MAG: BspA family leucine-rich repeat surface protein [Lactobacillaceae bacterium]|jgi:surface protein|nr:BspA family leucine-rich repeat surface protein [Lactobacillaceae bacterium]
MKIHNNGHRLVRAFLLVMAVVGAITLFTNMSLTGGPTIASAAPCEMEYDEETKTLTVEPGDLQHDFWNLENVSEAETVVFVSAETSLQKVKAPADSSCLFGYMQVKKFEGLQNFETTNAETMEFMFYKCENLTSVDLSHFDTRNVTTMSGMFYLCSGLTTLDLRSFDTTNVTIMSGMFNRCLNLKTINLSNFNTENVTTMWEMFALCRNLTVLDLSAFNTTKVNTMYEMFLHCASLTSVNLSSFNTPNLQYTAEMFSGCTSLTTLDLSSFDTTKINNMAHMFNQTTAMWKLVLGPNAAFSDSTDLADPIVGTPFKQTLKVSSPNWLYVTGGTDLNPTGVEYTATEVMANHLAGTYVWQGNLGDTSVEYTIQASYMVTIPAEVTIPDATTAGTGMVTLSDYPKLPFDDRFIHISAHSNNVANPWHLTTTADPTGAAYNFGTTDGGTEINDGAEIVFEANGEETTPPQPIFAKLAGSLDDFKYAGLYTDTVTFTIETAAS